MKLRREASILKGKALSSLRRALAAFNSYEDDGRATEVLLKLQHAFEMLLKAGLVQEQVGVFDKQLSQSIGFEKCVNLARQHLGLTADEAGTLRAIDALRDEAQHWYNEVSEGLLYSHARASVTLFDDLLQRAFGESLVSHLPHRVLPISSEPPKDIQLLIDEEFTQIAELLKPGRRRRPEACARIRTLLAMEAHVAENVRVSKRDVDRVQKGIRAGRTLPEVFPRLSEVGTEISGEGIHVAVRFVRNTRPRGQLLAVRFVGADDPEDAAAIREVDLQRRGSRGLRKESGDTSSVLRPPRRKSSALEAGHRRRCELHARVRVRLAAPSDVLRQRVLAPARRSVRRLDVDRTLAGVPTPKSGRLACSLPRPRHPVACNCWMSNRSDARIRTYVC
jgi:hypothetical protein